jgi:hypothetical protein
VGVHARFHGADVRYGGEIEVAPPHKGLHLAQEAVAE